MCYQLKCGICGKTAWAGCGKHLERLKGYVPVENRCHHVKWD